MAALSHLKILDLSRILAGPWASQLLGDLGAQVTKIERPGAGDDTRGWGPPWLADAAGQPTDQSAYFLCANRAKRSAAIDFTHPEGQAIVRALASQADVVLENFKVGGLARHGLDYALLSADNPRLVYCSITGFGQTGPYAERPGYDALIQAMGGWMSITGAPDAAGGGPQKMGVAVIDLLTGLYAATGILAALAHRDRTGEGQHIDLALLDVSTATLANQALNFLVGGTAPRRLGNAHPNIVPYQDFPTSDGAMLLAVGNDSQFARAMAVFGLDEMAAEPRFLTNPGRVAARAPLVAAIAAVTCARPTAEWVAGLEAAGVPCGPINDISAVFADRQVVARGSTLSLPHPLAGAAPGVANPLRLSATPVGYGAAAPLLGQHTAEVLAELGHGADAIGDLRARGVVGWPDAPA